MKIGPPRVRGKRIEGTPLELGVDPDILHAIGQPYVYNVETDEYWRIVRYNKKTGEMRLGEVVWHVSPWPQGRA